MPTPIGQVEQFEPREVEFKVGDVWQFGGSFLECVAVKSKSAEFRIVRDIRDVLKKRGDVEITDADWEAMG